MADENRNPNPIAEGNEIRGEVNTLKSAKAKDYPASLNNINKRIGTK